MGRIAVGAEAAGERLDRFLAGRMDGFSRSAVQRLVAGGRVLVNGAAVKPGHRLRGGERIDFSVPPRRPRRPQPRMRRSTSCTRTTTSS